MSHRVLEVEAAALVAVLALTSPAVHALPVVAAPATYESSQTVAPVCGQRVEVSARVNPVVRWWRVDEARVALKSNVAWRMTITDRSGATSVLHGAPSPDLSIIEVPAAAIVTIAIDRAASGH